MRPGNSIAMAFAANTGGFEVPFRRDKAVIACSAYQTNHNTHHDNAGNALPTQNHYFPGEPVTPVISFSIAFSPRGVRGLR